MSQELETLYCEETLTPDTPQEINLLYENFNEHAYINQRLFQLEQENEKYKQKLTGSTQNRKL